MYEEELEWLKIMVFLLEIVLFYMKARASSKSKAWWENEVILEMKLFSSLFYMCFI